MAWVRLAGLVVGMAAALVLVRVGPTGAAAPAVAAAIVVAVLVSEVQRPRPERQPGVAAPLEVRRIRDYIRLKAAGAVLLLGLILVAELAVLLAGGRWQRDGEAITAGPVAAWAPSSSGGPVPTVVPRAERVYAVVCERPGVAVLSYVAPSAVHQCVDEGRSRERAVNDEATGAAAGTIGTALAAVLVGAFALRATVRAPRPGADGQTRQRDERWRQGRAETTVATVGWILAVPLALWNIALVLAEDSATLSGPAGYARLAGFAVLAAAGTVAAALSAAALSRFPGR